MVFCCLFEPGDIQVVREGVARLFALDDAEADSHVQAPGCRSDLVFVEREAVGDASFVIHLGEIAAPAEAGLEEFPEAVLVESGRLNGVHRRTHF
jgi:hypothetical protein